MVKLTIDGLISLYFGTVFSTLLVLWTLFYFRSSKIKRFSKELKTCEFCHGCYIKIKRRNLSRCPSCGLLNES